MKESWISQRIVNSLNLKSRPHKSRREANFNGGIIKSTGRFVEFSFGGKEGAPTRHYRFYIVEHGGFDVLFGRDLLL
jgi:hypothetical protein